VSLYPLMVEGSALFAVVVGGGPVATRKVTALLDAGAKVRVVAPQVSNELLDFASKQRIELVREPYSHDYLGDAALIIAATNDASVNARIAQDVRALGRLVNIVTAPSEGNCITPAVHRSGDVVVAVSAGGVPDAAARIRDAIGQRLDTRYADAVRSLSTLRRQLIDGGERDRWTSAAAALIDDDFCRRVDSGQFAEAMREWR
jgi:precorrin-2 dehydrogenase/sirohydrochlorin ferrochelatase